MIIGIIATTDQASSLLDNLSEADFDEVSVIMKDEQVRNTIAEDAGPLKGITINSVANFLAKYDAKKPEIKNLTQALENGQILIAVQTDINSQESAKQMLQTYTAQNIIAL